MIAVRDQMRAMQPGATQRASILITSYNTRAWLDRCLTAVLQEELDDTEIVVLENGSSDGSDELVRNRYPAVQLLVVTPNIGYVRAVNRLLVASHGRIVVLLDSDAEPEPDALRRLLDAMEADPSIGATAPRLVGDHGKLQRWTAGHLPGFRSVSAYYLGIDRLAGRFGWDIGWFLARDIATPADVAWLCSCCLAIRREALTAVGLMNERYFSYMGDLDLCERIGRAGWRMRYNPTVTVRHAQGRNTIREPGHAAPEAINSLNEYLELHVNPLTYRALAVMQAAGYAGRALLYACFGTARHDHFALRQARMHWKWFRIRCGFDAGLRRTPPGRIL